VLSPFKQKTEAGVNSLNRMLREAANPPDLRKAEWNTENGMFRQGDKLMQTKNTDVISNGDIGRLTIIGRKKDGTRTITVDFGDTKKEYEEEELDILELAYATSIHKSQGAEFPVVILPVLSCFYPMLKRNVYYTGVTRARARVHLVGTKKALAIAISQNDAGKRNTLLALRLRQEAVRRGMEENRKAA
ncbi:MAG: ATP-binding domain-containing protein, partial [Agathobacter sp.]